MRLKVFTAFSGYDSQCMALERIKEAHKDFDYELVGWSEIDSNAIKLHDANFPEAKDRNYGDISKVEWDKVPGSTCLRAVFPVLTSQAPGDKRGLKKALVRVRRFFGSVVGRLPARNRNTSLWRT
jgi:hypothetical protein